jgi:hypothetical protein
MRKTASIFALALVFAALQLVPALSLAASESLPPELLEQLRATLGKKNKELLEEKNDLGVSYIFGSYYNDFTPAGDGYNVTYIKRISNPDELIAERYTLTLGKQGGAWAITDEKLEQRIEGYMYRSVPRDETFHRRRRRRLPQG